MIFERNRFRLTARATFICLVLGILSTSLAGFLTFTSKVPRVADPPSRKTEAIVVLTGGSDRLITGLDLLDAGWAQKMFVSGVPNAVDVRTLLAVVKRDVEELYDGQVEIGHEARDTVGNARETAKWMAAQEFESLRLVTAGYHMLRSLREFAHVMPGVEIVPHPVFPANVHLDKWWRWPGTTALLLDEYVKYLVSYLRFVIQPRVSLEK